MDEGVIRFVGLTTHQRKLAARRAERKDVSLLMIRYNAAHPGAERDIFPHLTAARPRIVLAYTATRWRKLLKRPKGWEGPVMTAADCYRFCLSSPHVHAVLGGPKSLAQLDENLAGLHKGPVTEAEARWMREYGRIVHG